MIVTNVGGLAEMVPHHRVGYVTEPSSDAVRLAIQHFFTEQKKDFFIQNIKQEKQRFGWDVLMHAIIKHS
jgi:hypothetical protein